LGTALKRVKEQLRGIPQHGIGFGMLKYLSEDETVREQMRVIQFGQVNFNYLGQFDQVAEDNALIKGAKESAGPAQSLKNPLPTLITINCSVQGRRLEMIWTYSEIVHRRETIEWLAEKYLDSLRDIIAHCQEAETEEFTMSDFPLSGLDQGQFDRLSTLISELDN
jgi:non-ribosomal peptide synthase protein (TIGR01720 family)